MLFGNPQGGDAICQPTDPSDFFFFFEKELFLHISEYNLISFDHLIQLNST